MDYTSKTREQLIEIAQALNIKVHHKAKPETIISHIMQQGESRQRDVMKHEAETPVAPVIVNDEETIRAAVMRKLEQFQRSPIGQKLRFDKTDFKMKFPVDEYSNESDGTWIFRCRRKGDEGSGIWAEESGNMNIPLRLIVQKAEFVAHGPKKLRSLGHDNTYAGHNDEILVF